MTDTQKRISLSREGATDRECANYLFPRVMAHNFWAGVFVGVLAMALMNIGDLHVCVGECDGTGFEITGGDAK